MLRITIEDDSLEQPVVLEGDFVILTMMGEEEIRSISIGQLHPGQLADVLVDNARMVKILIEQSLGTINNPIVKFMTMMDIKDRLNGLRKEESPPDNVKMDCLVREGK